jgi:hypothetical protein
MLLVVNFINRCCEGGGLALTPCILSYHHSVKINKHKRYVGCVSCKEVSRCYSGWVYLYLGDVNILVWTSVFWGCSKMEKKFSVEAKSFAIVVLDGASVLRVVEKRIFFFFFSKVVLSAQCSDWLASSLEVLMGIPEDQEFVKSFREGLLCKL